MTPDYLNPRHPWPHLDALAAEHARLGFTLRPRLPVYESYLTREGFLDPALVQPVQAAMARLDRPLGAAPARAAKITPEVTL